jgi:hypothetical protein
MKRDPMHELPTEAADRERRELRAEVERLRGIVEAVANNSACLTVTSSSTCPLCGGGNVHRESCPWLAARAYLAARKDPTP